MKPSKKQRKQRLQVLGPANKMFGKQIRQDSDNIGESYKKDSEADFGFQSIPVLYPGMTMGPVLYQKIVKRWTLSYK